MRTIGPITLAVFLLGGAVHAQVVATNATVRQISLEDCIEMGLRHNLSLQIERLNPRVQRLTLEGSYGSYDPVFSFRGQQNFSSSPGGYDPDINLTTPATGNWTENFSTGFQGTTPTGMRYELSGSVVRTSGKDPIFDETTRQYITFDRPFSYRSDIGLSFTQPLLKNFWIDGTRMQIKLNKKQLKISELILLQQVMNIVRSVEQAYYDLIYTRENVKVQQLALQLATRLVTENKRKVEIGTLAPLEEKQAESRAADALASLIEASNLVARAQNTLKGLITENYYLWHNVELQPTAQLSATPEIFNLSASWNLALETRPDYSQLKQELEKQNIVLKYRYNQLFPELDLIGSVGRSGLDTTMGGSFDALKNDDNPRWGGGALLTFPLTFRSDRANYKIAKEYVRQALLRLKQLEQQIVIEIDDAVKTAKSNLERVEATRQARVFAEAALDAEKKKLDSGKSTSFVVLSLQRDLTAAQSSEIRALVEYNKALADLYFKEGTNLRRNRVQVDVR